MPVRTNWFAPAIEVSDEDPFTDEPAQRVQDVGVPIDLTAERASLDVRVVELLAAESRLYDHGVTCAIRDRVDTSCSACPLTRRGVAGELCDVGREMERALTRLAVADDGQRRH